MLRFSFDAAPMTADLLRPLIEERCHQPLCWGQAKEGRERPSIGSRLAHARTTLLHPENRRQISSHDDQVALLGQMHASCTEGQDLATITATRDGSTYQLQIEDEAGKKGLFGLTSDQALQLAYDLDNLLADEEEELHPRPAASAPEPSTRWRAWEP
jgi:hypothetical protein